MENIRSLKEELSQLIGQEGILSDTENSYYSYDDCVPKVVAIPKSIQQVQDVLCLASEHGYSVIPVGSGTKLGTGNIPQKSDIVLALPRLNGIVEYEPTDLTVTVEAGMQLAELQTELAKNRQFLPLNPPYAERCTIGGIVATNASGPIRLRYGTARNQVLGLRVVHASGTVVKSGGKVVKNVAGYDLNKLYIGSFGTLGIITEVTLKLSPLPIHQAIIAAQFQTVQDAVRTGLNIVSSQTLPTFVNLSVKHPINLFPADKPTLIIGFGGEPETVTWQLNTVQTLLEQNDADGVQIIEDEPHNSMCDEIQEFPNVVSELDKVIVKVNLKRTDIANYLDENIEDADKAMVLLGNGVIYLKKPISSGADLQHIANTLTQMRQRAINVGGNLIIESAPTELKRLMDVWGPIGSTLNLMKQIKAKFDPDSLFNPGRFISSI